MVENILSEILANASDYKHNGPRGNGETSFLNDNGEYFKWRRYNINNVRYFVCVRHHMLHYTKVQNLKHCRFVSNVEYATFKTIPRPRCQVLGCDKLAQNQGRSTSRAPYVKFKKTYCENLDARLGFKCTTTIIPEYGGLTVDHINEDHFDNRPENLQTLCPYCHHVKNILVRRAEEVKLILMLKKIYATKLDLGKFET